MTIRFLDEEPQSGGSIRFLDEEPPVSTPQVWLSEAPMQDIPPVQRQSDTLRNIGLGARFGLQGIAAPVTIGSDILGAGLNAYTGKEIIPSLGGMVSETLTNVGLPQPVTPRERIVGDVLQGATGGGAVSKLGGKLASAAAGLLGGAAAGGVRELGGNIPAQIGAGLIGGVAGGGAAQRALKSAAAPTPLLQDVAERGLDEVAAFSNLRSSISQEAAKEAKRTTKLFNNAKSSGAVAFLNNDAKTDLINTFKDRAANEIDVKAKDILLSAATKLEESPGSVLLNDIETIRKSASRISRMGGSEGYAGGVVKSAIDDIIAKPENILGDKKAGQLWNKAIQHRVDYGNRFEKPQEIAKALTDATNETIEQTFIGSGGAALNKDLSKVYKDTVRALPSKQREQGAFQLRQSIVNRMIKNSARSVDDPEGLSASRLGNQIRNFRRENPSMWAQFKPQERDVLRGLEVGLKKTTEGGVVNKVYSSLERLISRGLRANVELPRTLKPKTVVTVDDLLELTTIRPKARIIGAATVGATQENE